MRAKQFVIDSLVHMPTPLADVLAGRAAAVHPGRDIDLDLGAARDAQTRIRYLLLPVTSLHR